jgi:hypothetical protein
VCGSAKTARNIRTIVNDSEAAGRCLLRAVAAGYTVLVHFDAVNELIDALLASRSKPLWHERRLGITLKHPIVLLSHHYGAAGTARRRDMKTYLLRLITFSALIALALAIPAAAHEAGPHPPPSANASSKQLAQSSTQKSEPEQDTSSHAKAPPSASDKDAPIEVPVGTHIPLVLHNAISTRTARAGDPVYFETSFPVLVNGRVVIPAGSYVSGEVIESKRPGRIHGRGQLMIRLTTMILPNAYIVKLNAVPGGPAGTGGNETVNNEGKIEGAGNKGGDAGTVINTTVQGTEVGTAVGAATGDIGRGAGIGAGIGAAAGLAAVLLSRGPDAELPRGTTLDAVLDRPLFLDASKVQFTSPGESAAVSGPPNREPQRYRTPF